MLNKEIEFLRTRYNKVLSIIDIQKQAEADTYNFFDFQKEDADRYERTKFHKYDNPFYDRFEDVIRKIRDSTISFIIHLFTHKYPNVPLSHSEFDAFLGKDEYGNREISIDFDKVQNYIDKVEKNKDNLSLNNLIEESVKLIPHEFTRGESWDKKKPFKATDIHKNKKLVLHSGWSYSSANTSHTPSMLKLINIILNEVDPSTAEETNNVYIKYFKNGRMDIEFNTKEESQKVAEFLEKNQNGTTK